MAITLPNVPTLLVNPKVDSKVAQLIQVALDTNLGWLDRAYHIARVGKDKEQKGDYPILSANDGTDENYNIRPDNKIGAYSFFEVERPFTVDFENDEITCFFSLVFWCNLKLIDPSKQYDYTSELIKDVLDVLNTYQPQGLNIETRPERVFDKYSGLQQESKQHLMRQYSGFKITFETTQPYTDNCNPSPIDSCTQNVARINALPTSVRACVVAAVSDCDTDTFLNFVFGIGATADYTTTIASGEEGTYTANTLTNASSVAYYKNAVLATLPITLAIDDTLRVVPTITNTAIEARVKLIGTY